MEEYKARFIDFLLRTGALRVGGDYNLKSKRISPWFVNIGDFNDGETSAALGQFYADAIINSGEKFDLLYGIPEKGNSLAVATAIGLSQKGRNVPWFFTRKIPKEYGEATNLSQAERIKALVVGRAPKNGQSIVQLDDVFTAGDAKYQAREILQSLGDFRLSLLAIAVDRQEVGIDASGRSAIEEYEQKTETKVSSVVNALDVYNFLTNPPTMNSGLSLDKHVSSKLELLIKKRELENSAGNSVADLDSEIEKLSRSRDAFNPRAIERMATYLRVYGTEKARGGIIGIEGKLEQKIIESEKSVIPACDVSSLEDFEGLVRDTADVEGIGGYKIPAISGRKGWEKWIEIARKYTNKPLIYDHQKAGTDIPDTGQEFMKNLKEAGFDSVILFPQSGPETERAWIYHALDKGLRVIVGGRMTHPAYAVSEGGFITDEGALEMYKIAARAGISNFVVPGNKPEVIKQIREVVEAEGVLPVFYAPGFIAQGGSISDAAKAAGDRFHGIVGRGIYQAQDKRAAAIEHTSRLG